MKYPESGSFETVTIEQPYTEEENRLVRESVYPYDRF